MVLLPHPAGPVTMRIWWLLVIVIVTGFVVFNEVEDIEGDPVLDIGGVGGEA
jgi:hypothetical protein